MATSLVSSFLVPFVKEGAEKLREKLAGSASDAVADKLTEAAGTLWNRVKSSPRSDKDQRVLSVFEEDPDLVREAMERIVREQLEVDESFRAEVAAVLEAQAQPGTPNWTLMGHIVGAVDARGATISGGTVAGVVYQAGPQAPPPPPPSEA
ncbi:MAG: hypothetical protein ABI140_15800 [Jatrophihabitantaceae bacterium]